jgi:hypothetical protein
VCPDRRLRSGGLSQEQGEEGEDDFYGGAATSAAVKLPTGLESGRPGSRAHSPSHRSQQTGDPGLVPEFEG